MNLNGLRYNLNVFLSTPKGKRIKYEVNSFFMTFLGAFIAVAGIDPVLSVFLQDGLFHIGLLPALYGSLIIAFGRAIAIRLSKAFADYDYRKDTKDYK